MLTTVHRRLFGTPEMDLLTTIMLRARNNPLTHIVLLTLILLPTLIRLINMMTITLDTLNL